MGERLFKVTDPLEASFPPASHSEPARVYEASLSTMWAIKNFAHLADFFDFARQAGFASIELNHKVNSAMLAGIDLGRYQFRSIHEPCPADISADELKNRDWLISSTDEDRRREGVRSIRRTIDLARELSVPTIVIHAGQVRPDPGWEKQLRALIAAGQQESDEYQQIRRQMVMARADVAATGLASVKRSLSELLEHAAAVGVCLGIENRYHYLEYPGPEELETLLALAGPDQLGFIYDVGHAEALDRLGFYPHEEWLQRFAPRIVGTHLHDVLGTTDHYAPALGDVDFSMVAAYLPARAFRTCEFQNFNTPEQVKAGLQVLVEQGCIQVRG